MIKGENQNKGLVKAGTLKLDIILYLQDLPTDSKMDRDKIAERIAKGLGYDKEDVEKALSELIL